MPEVRDLEKQLKLVAKTGKYVVGRREVMSGMKGTKLLVWSASAGLPQTILDDSKSLQIPAVRFSGNPVELGRACGIPFRVSVMAVKSTGDADLKAFSNSADYLVTATSSGALMQVPSPTETPVEKEDEGKKKRKKPETKSKSEEESKSTKKKKTSEEKGEEKPARKKSKAGDAEEKPKKAKKESKKKSSEDE